MELVKRFRCGKLLFPGLYVARPEAASYRRSPEIFIYKTGALVSHQTLQNRRARRPLRSLGETTLAIEVGSSQDVRSVRTLQKRCACAMHSSQVQLEKQRAIARKPSPPSPSPSALIKKRDTPDLVLQLQSVYKNSLYFLNTSADPANPAAAERSQAGPAEDARRNAAEEHNSAAEEHTAAVEGSIAPAAAVDPSPTPAVASTHAEARRKDRRSGLSESKRRGRRRKLEEQGGWIW